ncbi:hypothetical protein [Sulfuricurvum sp.]|uniref:hypothetical protein n=1 Tax=Sulfuricurvum sp. TaxID=2025608 RepID=UPI002E2EBB73|nr:hypothetical protein [Sulfuricurvum sp.]HEX5328858.1 hypothetical protein [Sulfuricurvum sp.]
MLEASKAALQKAGSTIESLRNRIKELEYENAKLKEPKTCDKCDCKDTCNLFQVLIDELDFEKNIDMYTFGCIDHRKAP